MHDARSAAPPELPEDERDFSVRGWLPIGIGIVIGARSVDDWLRLDESGTTAVLLFLMALGLVALGAWGVMQRYREQRYVALPTVLEPEAILDRVVSLAREQGWSQVGVPRVDAMAFDEPPRSWSDSTRRVRVVVRGGIVYVNSIAGPGIHPVANAHNIELVRMALNAQAADSPTP